VVASKSDTIRSFIRDYKTQLRVGVYESEKHAPQTVIINIEMEMADAPHYYDPAETNLERVIDYVQVHSFIADELPRLGHIPLLETLAETIIAFCFRDPLVINARVRLEKPTKLPGVAGVGVEMFRVRGKA
jgi:dihydroneopterin aldolase